MTAPGEDHRHEFDHDTVSSPSYLGAVTVTEWCACGHAIQTYTDWIR